MASTVGARHLVHVCNLGQGMGFSHMLFLKYCESFLISFVSLPLIKNLAAMLCKSKPAGTLFESHLRNQRHRERLGRVCGGGDRDRDGDLGSSGEHPRETQKPPLGGKERER